MQNTDNLTSSLIRLGLTERQIEIYIYLLQAGGRHSTDEIAEFLHIKYQNCNRQLDLLYRMGWVEKHYVWAVHFSAVTIEKAKNMDYLNWDNKWQRVFASLGEYYTSSALTKRSTTELVWGDEINKLTKRLVDNAKHEILLISEKLRDNLFRQNIDYNVIISSDKAGIKLLGKFRRAGIQVHVSNSSLLDLIIVDNKYLIFATQKSSIRQDSLSIYSENKELIAAWRSYFEQAQPNKY